jgi:hypothetical protein
MSYTLSQLLQDSIALLGSSAYFRGTATGGGTTSIIDTTLLEKSEEEITGGTAFIVRDAGGAAALPESRFAKATGYTSSSYTIAITTIEAVGSGDEYMFVSPQYPLIELIRIVNLSLQRIGVLKRWDTSLTTASSKTEYALPIAMKLHSNNMAVWIQGNKTNALDNDWKRSSFRIVESTPGVAGILIIPQYASGYKIGIEYEITHPAVYAYSDIIDEAIHPVLAQLYVATELFAWIGITDDNRDQANKILNDLAEAKRLYSLPRIAQQKKSISLS